MQRLLEAALLQRRLNARLQRVQSKRFHEDIRDVEPGHLRTHGRLIVRGHQEQNGIGAKCAEPRQQGIGITHSEIPEDNIDGVLESETTCVWPG